MRLFIADDSDILRSRLVDMLEEIEGVDIVGQARGASEAIENIEALNPDVIIMDIRMPDGDGINVLETIRRRLRSRSKVIIFTNYPYLQYQKRCMDIGADFFFYKALEFENLVKLIRELAGSF
jgi:DNA-binding NarL/FixJ family response regulator